MPLRFLPCRLLSFLLQHIIHHQKNLRFKKIFRAISDAAKCSSAPFQMPPSFLQRHIRGRQVFFRAISDDAKFSSAPYQMPLSMLPHHIRCRAIKYDGAEEIFRIVNKINHHKKKFEKNLFLNKSKGKG